VVEIKSTRAFIIIVDEGPPSSIVVDEGGASVSLNY
jgi:hypothetical protein